MTARRILLVYGTTYGQTAKIARFMADMLTASGDTVTLVNARQLQRDGALPRGLSLHDFDGAIVGSSVLYGRHQRCVRRFARIHREELDTRPSAFFSVSGAAASREAAKLAEARRVVGEFEREAGWRPELTEIVAGAMAYTKDNALYRWLLRRRAAREGAPTDVSRDHEFTDWAQVRRFVDAFAATIPHAPVSANA